MDTIDTPVFWGICESFWGCHSKWAYDWQNAIYLLLGLQKWLCKLHKISQYYYSLIHGSLTRIQFSKRVLINFWKVEQIFYNYLLKAYFTFVLSNELLDPVHKSNNYSLFEYKICTVIVALKTLVNQNTMGSKLSHFPGLLHDCTCKLLSSFLLWRSMMPPSD